MAFRDIIAQLIAKLFLENPSKGQSFAQLRSALESSGSQLQSRFTSSRANLDLLRHVITIERWGQSRLRSALGEVQFVLDRSEQYAPASTLGWDELKSEFATVRQETLEIVRRLELANPIPNPVVHNHLGTLSVKGWLRYLNVHANTESRKFRSA